MGRPLTPLSTLLFDWFSGMLIIGLIFGNLIFIYMGLIPLFLLVFGLTIDQPSEVSVERELSEESANLNDLIKIKLKIRIENGIGTITFKDKLPSCFEIIEGNNLNVIWKGFGKKEKTITYKIKCNKRGSYKIPKTEWESEHILNLRKNLQGKSKKRNQLIVSPKKLQIRNPRGKKELAFFRNPQKNLSRIGFETSDFKEIREYVGGDPIRKINWKATARMSKKKSKPLVNEYETEGEKTIWIFLDASSSMEIGTLHENSFEYAIKAAIDLIHYFIDQRYKVGIYIYGNDGKIFYPSGGEKQSQKLMEELVSLETQENGKNFNDAFEECKDQILRRKPSTVIITRTRKENHKPLKDGIKKLRVAASGQRIASSSIALINVQPHNLGQPQNPEYRENASTLQKLRNKPTKDMLKGMGVTVLDWNPSKEDFSEILFTEGGRR